MDINDTVARKILKDVHPENHREFKKVILDELLPLLPDELKRLLYDRSGVAKFLKTLPKAFDPESVLEINGVKGKNQRAWELIGYFYRKLNRWYESLAIFRGLYNQMLIGQSVKGIRGHKGVPLVNMYECYTSLGCPVLAKRYLMLTLCEDAITKKGFIRPNSSGVYFRLVWFQGISHERLTGYSKQIYQLYKKHPKESWFPEWILQELDQDWMVEIPAPQEALIFTANNIYIQNLLSSLGDGTGKNLERLASYLLSCMPGCKTYTRVKTESSDLDIVCSLEGFDVDFRSELGRYFVCECKDWSKKAGFSILAKFCYVLDSTKSKFGILFSKEGISGKGKTKFAERAQLKVFQDRGMVIVIVDQDDLKQISNGANFITMLRNKYRRVRLDLSADSV